MKLRVAYVLATWFGSGHVPKAPGTAGTIAALPLYFVLRPGGFYAVLAGAIAVTAVGVWSAGVVAAARGEEDPQVIVIDEVAGLLVTLAPAAPGLLATLIGVVAFRVCDQVKPWPAHVFEDRLPGGWGIVLDDVAAGVWAALALWALQKCGT